VWFVLEPRRLAFTWLTTIDDIIKRLTPSLQKHANCDIIDVNPGAGLWSSKLHDAVKPRSHILFEPDFELYQPFLQPLLDKKGSKYKLIPKSGILWDNLNLVKSKDYLPSQEVFSKGDARLEKSNDSLLFIANLGHYPSKIYQGFPSISALMVHQLLSAVRTHSLFQEYGLVRMLIWMHDKEKKVAYPRVITHRKKFSIEAEISCENIFEIAGSDEFASRFRREHRLDLEGARTVLSRMTKANIETPSARMGKLQTGALHNLEIPAESGTSAIRPILKDLEEMEARYARREFCSYYGDDGKPVYLDAEIAQRGPKGLKRTPEYLQLLALRWRLNYINSNNDRVDHFLVEYESILAEQQKLAQVDTPDAQERKDELRKQLLAWKAQVDRLPPNVEPLLWQRIDDRRAFRQDPPILLWDRREAEPLAVFEEDFFPQHEMCLLDFHPKSIWPVFQGEKIANYDYVEFILSALFINPTHSIIRGLKALAPGADEWIIPRCPSLTNTAKGGLTDLNLLSIRTLNQDMLREIMEAWMDWPFRPTKGEMISKMGNRGNWSGDDDDFELKD
jgi:mitochondrial transcription factor 1